MSNTNTPRAWQWPTSTRWVWPSNPTPETRPLESELKPPPQKPLTDKTQ